MEKPKFTGCGAAANRICYRGYTKRTYMCETCAPSYEGSGKVHPYATDVAGKDKPEGHHTGAAKKCGDETL